MSIIQSFYYCSLSPHFIHFRVQFTDNQYKINIQRRINSEDKNEELGLNIFNADLKLEKSFENTRNASRIFLSLSSRYFHVSLLQSKVFVDIYF